MDTIVGPEVLGGVPLWAAWGIAVLFPIIMLAIGGIALFMNDQAFSAGARLLYGGIAFLVQLALAFGIFGVDFELIERLGAPQGSDGLGIVLQCIAGVAAFIMLAVGTFDD